VFDDLDCLEEPVHSTDVGRTLIWKYFGVDDQMDMLQFYYTKFVKSHIAGLTESMSQVQLSTLQLKKILSLKCLPKIVKSSTICLSGLVSCHFYDVTVRLKRGNTF
jgi:hypothetical protein